MVTVSLPTVFFWPKEHHKQLIDVYRERYEYYGHGPSMEDFMSQTPLTVGSPQEILEKTLSFKEYFGDYHRQVFLIDHAVLPLKTVLNQLDLFVETVLSELRAEYAKRKPADHPQDSTHANRLAADHARTTKPGQATARV